MRKLRSLAMVLGALVLLVGIPATAHANVLTLLPQNADGLEQTFSPPSTTTATAATPPPRSAPTARSIPG